jgi:lipoprotein-anchoring transpeptidase ErfK/SrfK
MAEPTAVTPRSARRAARRRRIQIAVAGGLALVLFAVLAVVLFAGDGSKEPVAAKAAPATTTTTTTTIPPTTTTTTPPPAVTATTNVPNLQVFDAPNGTKVVTTLSAKTDYLQPRTLLITEDNGEWLKALLPIRPNGSTGWIRRTDVTLAGNPYEIRISLADHKLVMLKEGKEVLSSATVNGAPRTPTPPGIYYITDPVDLRSNPNGGYGAYALGISGFSEVLFEFNGGPGQLAVHGTPNPEQVGSDISNGCIRVPNDIIVEIAKQAPLGTPVLIT